MYMGRVNNANAPSEVGGERMYAYFKNEESLLHTLSGENAIHPMELSPTQTPEKDKRLQRTTAPAIPLAIAGATKTLRQTA